MSRTPEDPSTHDTPPQPVRRPYEPPCVEESGSFERLVLSCSHKPGVSFCEDNPPTNS